MTYFVRGICTGQKVKQARADRKKLYQLVLDVIKFCEQIKETWGSLKIDKLYRSIHASLKIFVTFP